MPTHDLINSFPDQNTEAMSIAAIALHNAAHAPIFREHDNAALVIWPASREIRSLEQFGAFPLRKRANVQAGDAVSFARYVHDHDENRTLVLADPNEHKFTAILDYHRGGSASDDHEAGGWGQHRVTYPLQLSVEFVRWTLQAARDLPQREFAEFLEDNYTDIHVPEGEAGKGYPNATQAIDVAISLQAKTEVAFSSAVRLQNGQVALNYMERIDATAGADGRTMIPERFAIAIPVYRSGPRYLITARLRYRLSSGKVTFRYELERLHKVKEQAFDVCRAEIAQAIADIPLQVFTGVVDMPAKPAAL